VGGGDFLFKSKRAYGQGVGPWKKKEKKKEKAEN
jgi:hypothetical protein